MAFWHPIVFIFEMRHPIILTVELKSVSWEVINGRWGLVLSPFHIYRSLKMQKFQIYRSWVLLPDTKVAIKSERHEIKTWIFVVVLFSIWENNLWKFGVFFQTCLDIDMLKLAGMTLQKTFFTIMLTNVLAMMVF